MCGICGFVRCGNTTSPVERRLGLQTYLKRMVDIQSHRGPDGYDIFLREHQRYAVGLGHNRLSIIDLSDNARQPLRNEDGTVWITYNGEIYNYLTLRTKLKKAGHQFVSASDTEVLVHGYEEWGTGLFARLDGIFAFAIWDDRSKSLFLCRDYFGVKPLHYYLGTNTLRFSSEIKAILSDDTLKRDANNQAIHNLVNLRYNVSQETLFKGIFRLKPGTFAVYTDVRFHEKKYGPALPEPDSTIDRQTAVQGIQQRLIGAVQKQLISDVPVGINLSGGMDSGTLAAIRGKILGETGFHTFTLGFPSERNEMDDAGYLAKELDTNHHPLFAAPDFLAGLPLLIWHLEEPKINAMQSFLLSHLVSKHVKVVFSGLGGDELFAGYNCHRLIRLGETIGAGIPLSIRERTFPKWRKMVFDLQQKTGKLYLDEPRRSLQMLFSTGNPTDFYLIPRNAWDGDEKMWTSVYDRSFLKTRPNPVPEYFEKYFLGCAIPDLEKTLQAEFWTKMIDDLLLNEDRVFMANGVESRVPFLDKDLVHFAFSIPADLKIEHGVTKTLLKKAMHGTLPDWMINQKKAGFQVSSYTLFKKGLRDLVKQTLTKACVRERGIFNFGYIEQIINAKPCRSMRWHYFFLLLLVGLEYWFRIFVDRSLKIEPFVSDGHTK